MYDWSMGTYDLESLKLPVLTGAGLRLFAGAVNNPLIRPLLLGSLLESGGITKLRRIDTGETTLFSPLRQAARPGGALPLDQVVVPSRGEPGAKLGSCYTTTSDYAARYRKGDLTPVEVAERLFAALEAEARERPPLAVFIAVDTDDAFHRAE